MEARKKRACAKATVDTKSNKLSYIYLMYITCHYYTGKINCFQYHILRTSVCFICPPI